jgi:hypothetical protein
MRIGPHDGIDALIKKERCETPLFFFTIMWNKGHVRTSGKTNISMCKPGRGPPLDTKPSSSLP